MDSAELRSAVLEALDEQDDDARTISDAMIDMLIEQANGDFRQAVYRGALYKSRADQITLPDGTTLPSQRDYWLGVAQAYRPNRGGTRPRADGV